MNVISHETTDNQIKFISKWTLPWAKFNSVSNSLLLLIRIIVMFRIKVIRKDASETWEHKIT